MTRQQMQMMQQQLLQRRRDEQERLILRKLQSMSPERLKQLQDNLTPDQLKMLVDRIQYLKQTQQQATQQKGQPTPRDQNTVISMANRIRTIKDPNALTATSTSTRVPSRSNGGVSYR
nr:hypothetical protein BaRGS_000652 [Batillaria attramentaria]